MKQKLKIKQEWLFYSITFCQFTRISGLPLPSPFTVNVSRRKCHSTDFWQHDPSLMLAIHSMLSLRWWALLSTIFCQTSQTRCPYEPTCDLRINAKVSGCSYCYNSWSKRQQKLPYADDMWNHSLHHQHASLAKFNRISVKWLGEYFTYKVTAPWWDGSYSEGKQSSPRCEGPSVWRAGVGSGVDWVSWHNRRANAGNKSVSLTWCLSSSDILQCPHQLQTNKDVWEDNRSDHSRCQGEMHLVSGLERYIRSEKSIRNDYRCHCFLNLGLIQFRSIFIRNMLYHLNLKNVPYYQIEVQLPL